MALLFSSTLHLKSMAEALTKRDVRFTCVLSPVSTKTVFATDSLKPNMYCHSPLLLLTLLYGYLLVGLLRLLTIVSTAVAALTRDSLTVHVVT